MARSKNIKREALVGQINPNTFQPSDYVQMDEWINLLPQATWTSILGAYASAAFGGIVEFLRKNHPFNVRKWSDQGLHQYFQTRKFSDFKGRGERVRARNVLPHS